jgi:hypothetical protein
MKIVKEHLYEELSPSGALYGFGGWLTTRDEPVTMSGSHDAAIVAELIDDFITTQDLDQPEDHWEDDLVPMEDGNYIKADFVSSHDMNEGNLRDETEDVKGKIERSKKIPKELKDKIIPLLISRGIHGSAYLNGRVRELKIPKVKGKSFKGVSLGADKDGFYVFTHRAASKRYKEIEDIPQKDINFIESTG